MCSKLSVALWVDCSTEDRWVGWKETVIFCYAFVAVVLAKIKQTLPALGFADRFQGLITLDMSVSSKAENHPFSVL